MTTSARTCGRCGHIEGAHKLANYSDGPQISEAILVCPDGLFTEAMDPPGQVPDDRPFIVAEVTCNWQADGIATRSDGPPLSVRLEQVINANAARGYHLVTFDRRATMVGPLTFSETCIAVFQRVQATAAAPRPEMPPNRRIKQGHVPPERY